MVQKLENGYLLIKSDNREEISKIKSWRMFKENKKEGYWYAEVSKTMLEKVKANGGLIPSAMAELERLQRVQRAVDYVRSLPDDKIPQVVKFPVKAQLFKHQQRGVIMTLLTFGVLKPEDVGVQ